MKFEISVDVGHQDAKLLAVYIGIALNGSDGY